MKPNYPETGWICPDEMVYALRSPDGDVRYIGRTHNPRARYAGHWYSKGRLGVWVRSTGALMVQIEFCKSGKTHAGPREYFWINHYRSLGADLFNVLPRSAAIEQDRAA